jgi:hypothetical protein
MGLRGAEAMVEADESLRGRRAALGWGLGYSRSIRVPRGWYVGSPGPSCGCFHLIRRGKWCEVCHSHRHHHFVITTNIVAEVPLWFETISICNLRHGSDVLHTALLESDLNREASGLDNTPHHLLAHHRLQYDIGGGGFHQTGETFKQGHEVMQRDVFLCILTLSALFIQFQHVES